MWHKTEGGNWAEKKARENLAEKLWGKFGGKILVGKNLEEFLKNMGKN